MTINQFFKECHKREVFKMLSIYIVSSWVILQVLSVIWKPLNLPEKSITVLIILLLIGFPVYIFYIWKSRLKYTVSTDVDDATEVKNRKAFEHFFFSGFGIIAFFCSLSVLILINNNFTNSVELKSLDMTDKIAVLSFENNTGDDKFDIVSKLSLDLIQHGITENNVGQVITQSIVNDYSSAMQTKNKLFSDEDILNTYLKPSKTITGTFFLKDNSLIFNSSIIDGSKNETLISFKPVECNSDRPLVCIDELQQKILGYFVTEKDKKGIRLQHNPPKFEAYQLFREAEENFENKDVYLDLLNKSIEVDSNYFEPKVNKFLHYYNQRKFKIADSLRLAILPKSGVSKRQRNLLNHYDALIKGDNRKIYQTALNEYKITPFHLRTNQSMMTIALQRINRPDLIDDIFKMASWEAVNIDNCLVCVFSYFTKAYADLELGRNQMTIDTLESLINRSDNYILKKPLISAYVRTANYDKLNTLLTKIKLLHEKEDWEESNLYAGKEILVRTDSIDLANSYFQNLINSSEDKNNKNYANAHFYKGDYRKAEELLQPLLANDPENINHMVKLSISLFKNGKTEEANTLVSKLNDMRKDYQYGSIDYGIAQIFASQDKNDIAIEHLLMSVAAGNRYRNESFQNDYLFKTIKDSPKFDLIMNFWHD
ncbi:MAG: tetratricopeptide repeat protein [Bacteroidia bacterium]|nr:tetratricopeptide repeat protein [Bacteroidia bacterium]MBT8279020.1 tetratricopeptide repeat protein [Bacteroidia bacterium]NND24660.1 tetratricopeptide repeat protein [Flavobacteriaceae bacterium]NNL31825.1 tetratricopeptide repeat protein [Flavobacteriaceae bacterium]